MNETPSRSAEIDAFLAGLPQNTREALEGLRRTIATAAPAAVETIGYGIPAFKYLERPLVSFGAGKNHCSFYVQSPAVMEAHQDELAGYDTARGTIDPLSAGQAVARASRNEARQGTHRRDRGGREEVGDRRGRLIRGCQP